MSYQLPPLLDEFDVIRESTRRDVLIERFLQSPGLNADRDVPSADTYNTALAQKNIDRNPHFEILGTNATSALATITRSGLTLTTAGASGDQMILLPHLNTNATRWAKGWNTRKRIKMWCPIITGASIAATIIWAGFKLTNTSVAATDADQIYFRYEAGVNSGNWQVIYSIGSTLAALDTGVPNVASTFFNPHVVVDANRVPLFYINGVCVGQGTALTDNITFNPYIGVQASAAAAKAITIPLVAAASDF